PVWRLGIAGAKNAEALRAPQTAARATVTPSLALATSVARCLASRTVAPGVRRCPGGASIGMLHCCERRVRPRRLPLVLSRTRRGGWAARAGLVRESLG